jgi:EPS-associated MarR family transcriptional regulator
VNILVGVAINTVEKAYVLETEVKAGLRLKVMRVIEANPEMSQREIASKLGVSLGGVNYAIQALVERGFVTAQNFRKSGAKVAYLYALTPRGLTEKASLATAFLGRKLEEYEVLRQEIEELKSEIGSGDSGKGAES